MDFQAIFRASGWLAAAALVAIVAATASAAGVFDQAGAGPPRPPKNWRVVPDPYPLPGVWVAPGNLANPGGALPIEALDAHPLDLAPGGIGEAWLVRTWRAPQVLGSDPWGGLDVWRFDPDGSLIPRSSAELMAASAGRPVVFLIHGNLVSGRLAEGEALYSRGRLDAHGGLSPETLLVIFDWPAYQVFEFEPRDGSEKQRRAFVAGYHLARLLEDFPAGSRICLVGHSLGGRVILSALQLLGGGPLASSPPFRSVALPAGPVGHLRLRAVLIADGDDHHWLNPGRRYDRALIPVEGLLNLYNPDDVVVSLYPLTPRSGRRRALGHIGLQPGDRQRIGPLSDRVVQGNIAPAVGKVHTMAGALSHPGVAAWVAPYSFATEADPSAIVVP